jgi:hypothetical protein
VRSRADLVAFVRAMLDGLVTQPDGWENLTLDRFLEALSRWTEDMDGWFLNRGEPVPDEPSWWLVAQMRMAATPYE